MQRRKREIRRRSQRRWPLTKEPCQRTGHGCLVGDGDGRGGWFVRTEKRSSARPEDDGVDDDNCGGDGVGDYDVEEWIKVHDRGKQ